MKTTSIFWLGLTTLLLVALTLAAVLGSPFPWIFALTVLGQVLLGYTVYRVLTEPYSTNKTFDDFYEDSPYES